MRISFDIDDTLVLHGFKEAPTEPGRFPRFICQWLSEPLRLGTGNLIRQLREQGCSIWIYTSSGRTEFYIRLWLFLHGISVDGVVNEQRHRRELLLQNYPKLPSKYPPAFKIDLHVDDSDGVRIEGLQHDFNVVVIDPGDVRWAEKVLDAVNDLRSRYGAIKPSPATASAPLKTPPAPD
jgi:hypothetical protein